MAKQNTWMERAAGILLPVSSLPSKYGIGTFGKAAYQWVDFLAQAKQKYWQVLPLGPTSYGDSPYQSFSAFAGNPYFIDLELLCEQGLLKKGKCKKISWGESKHRVDYDIVYENREKVLRRAFSNFTNEKALESFRRKNKAWVEDYALYMAVKAKMDLKPWNEWDEEIRMRRPEALKKWRAQCAEDIAYHIFVQYLFFDQWGKLKKYANKKGVKIIGDAPIYVAMDSADVWASPQLFQLDENNVPTEVAGCPPDAFSEDGQLWGNPLYRWDEMAKDGFSWWLKRLKANLTTVDVLRIDHFRGLESYWAVPAESDTAKVGAWEKGPGMDLLNVLAGWFPQISFIAEDLGILTDAVHDLREASGLPGMRVLEFAFTGPDNIYLPHNYKPHCVCYTGTHDNDTAAGWYANASKEERAFAERYLGVSGAEPVRKALLRAGQSSVAELFVAQMQDYLGLGSEHRVNVPGVAQGNWRWRMLPGAASAVLAEEIRAMTEAYGRCEPMPEAPEGVQAEE